MAKLTEREKAERAEAARRVGERIRERREALGLSQTELAQRAGYRRRKNDAPVIYNLENGNRGHLPQPGPLRRISRALGTTTKELFEGIPKPKKHRRPTR